jgi:RHS repeat-associated protein
VPVHARAFVTVLALVAGLGLNVHGFHSLPCPGLMSASVSPHGGAAQRPAGTSGDTTKFRVFNNGACNDVYTLSYTAGAPISGFSGPATVSVPAGNNATVTVTYNVGSLGTGVLQLKARGNTMGSNGVKGADSGDVSITAIGAVVVTPKGPEPISVTPSTQQQLTFDVNDTAMVADSFNLTCAVTGSETCVSVTPSFLKLSSHEHGSATLTYTSGPSGTMGTVTFKAQSGIYGANTRDSSVYTVWNGPGPTPTTSLAPYSGARHNASAFDGVAAHATPAYWSVGTPRSLTLGYNASMARPIPVVAINVTASARPFPTTYGLQVQVVGGPTLTLLNGSQTVYFSAESGTRRIMAAIDAKATGNGLTTGWYDVNLIVTANFTGGTSTLTVPSRLLIDDESQTSFGAGWTLGIPRIRFKTGSKSVLLTEGDGSMSFFQRDSLTAPFISPGGDPTRLTAILTANGQSDSLFRRTNLDGSYSEFNSTGRLTRAVMPLNTTTTDTLTWTDTLLTSIRDVAGKTVRLSYNAGKLVSSSDPTGRVTQYTIDSLLRKVTEPNGDTTAFAYDGLKRLTRITDNTGGQTDYGYDTLNLLSSASSPSFQDYTGASVRQTTTFMAPDRHIWQPGIAGTSSNSPKLTGDTLLTGKITDALGATTTMTVDRFGLPVAITAPNRAVTSISRDTLGQPTLVSDPQSHMIYLYYTGYLLNRQTDPWSGSDIYYDHDTTTNMLITVRGTVVRQDIYYLPAYTGGPKNGPVDSVYSGNTGSYASATGGRLVSRHKVNQWGQDTLVTDGQGHTTKYVYADTGQSGNVAQVVDPFGRVVQKYHYDNLGRPDTSWVLEQGTYAPTVRTYDRLNRDSTVKNALGYATQYAYSSQGLTRVTDAKGQVYRFGLNALGMVVAQNDLADTTKADTTKYDVTGRVRSIRTRRGDAISFVYDSLKGQLLVRSGPDFPVDSFRYDSLGRWMVATDSNAYDSLTFDVRGRLIGAIERLAGGTTYTLTYKYDAFDRLIARSAPVKGIRDTIVYDPTKGTITRFCAAAVCAQPQAYDSDAIAHRIVYTDSLLQAAWSQVDTTNAVHRVTANGFINNTGTAINLSAFQKNWSYDSLERISHEDPPASDTGMGYWYDAQGQLTGSCHLQGTLPNIACFDEYGGDHTIYNFSPDPYRYDSAGNRTDASAAAVIGAGNRTTSFKGYNLTYDADGNVLTKYGTNPQWGTDSSTYSWDALDRLRSVTTWPAGGAHTTVTFKYDALGRRVSKTVNGVTQWYAHDGDNVAMILDSLGQRLKLELAWAPGSDIPAFVRGPSWTGVTMNAPQNATMRGIVSPTPGAPVRKRYDAAPGNTWGDMTTDTGTVIPIRLAGTEFDQEIKLYYMRARYYDPQLGRFLSEDPAGIAGGLDLYRYSGNDPINSRDPTGLTERVPSCVGILVIRDGVEEPCTAETLSAIDTWLWRNFGEHLTEAFATGGSWGFGFTGAAGGGGGFKYAMVGDIQSCRDARFSGESGEIGVQTNSQGSVSFGVYMYDTNEDFGPWWAAAFVNGKRRWKLTTNPMDHHFWYPPHSSLLPQFAPHGGVFTLFAFHIATRSPRLAHLSVLNACIIP